MLLPGCMWANLRMSFLWCQRAGLQCAPSAPAVMPEASRPSIQLSAGDLVRRDHERGKQGNHASEQTDFKLFPMGHFILLMVEPSGGLSADVQEEYSAQAAAGGVEDLDRNGRVCGSLRT